MKGEQEDLGQRFFRQFLDIKKLGGPKGSELSAIRQHCICHKYYNPDKTMYKCPDDGSGTWNHEECLIEAILDKTYTRLVEESGPAANGTEATVLSTVKDAVTKTLFPAEKLKNLRELQTSSSAHKPQVATPKSTSKSKKLKGANRRQGMFNAKIINGDETLGKGAKITITDERVQGPETWTEDVECLKCGKIFACLTTPLWLCISAVLSASKDLDASKIIWHTSWLHMARSGCIAKRLAPFWARLRSVPVQASEKDEKWSRRSPKAIHKSSPHSKQTAVISARLRWRPAHKDTLLSSECEKGDDPQAKSN